MRAIDLLERSDESERKDLDLGTSIRSESHPGLMLYSGMAALYGFAMGLIVGLIF